MSLDLMPEAWQKALLLPLVCLLFEGADNDSKSAWAQAINLICGFMPKTEPEFRLSVRIAILNIQSNLAFAWAAKEETTIPQAISLQKNGMALAKAADQIQARLLRLQKSRIEHANIEKIEKQAFAAMDAEREAAKTEAQKTGAQTATPKPATSQPKLQPSEAKAINEYARVNKMTYAQAWGLWQREKKAAQAQAELKASQPQSV